MTKRQFSTEKVKCIIICVGFSHFLWLRLFKKKKSNVSQASHNRYSTSLLKLVYRVVKVWMISWFGQNLSFFFASPLV